MAIGRSIRRGKGAGFAGGFRGRISLTAADPALPFPFDTGASAVEGTLAITAAATVDVAAAHGVAGTVVITAVATASIAGDHGVSGAVAIDAAATVAAVGAHGVAGALDASASASVSITAEVVGAEQPGGSGPAKRARARARARPRPVRLFFQRPPVEGELAIVAAAQVRMVGDAFPRIEGELAILAAAQFGGTGIARAPVPLRAIAPVAREGALHITAVCAVSCSGVFDAEQLDEEDLLLRASSPLELAA